jgi:hypothetical protein
MDLALRFTERRPLERPDLAAFAAVDHALLREQQADHDTSPLDDLIRASIVASQLAWWTASRAGAGAVLYAQRHWPIPAISTASSVIETPGRDRLRDSPITRTDTSRGRRRRGSRTAPRCVLAACIPMFMPDVAAAGRGQRQPAPTASPRSRPRAVVVHPRRRRLGALWSYPARAGGPAAPASDRDAARVPTQATLHAMRGQEATGMRWNA